MDRVELDRERAWGAGAADMFVIGRGELPDFPGEGTPCDRPGCIAPPGEDQGPVERARFGEQGGEGRVEQVPARIVVALHDVSHQVKVIHQD